MNENEMKALLTGANAIDPRVQVNVPTAGLWSRRLSRYSFAEAWAALEIYYDRDVEFRPPVDPPALRKIIAAESARAAAKVQALTAGPPAPEKSFEDYESVVKSPRFAELFEAGRRLGAEQRGQVLDA